MLESRDLEIFLWPHKASFLEVREKLVNNDNRNYAANDYVAQVNNGCCLFHTAEMQLNDKQVEQVYLNLPQAITMKNLVSSLDGYNESTEAKCCGKKTLEIKELKQESSPMLTQQELITQTKLN